MKARLQVVQPMCALSLHKKVHHLLCWLLDPCCPLPITGNGSAHNQCSRLTCAGAAPALLPSQLSFPRREAAGGAASYQ